MAKYAATFFIEVSHPVAAADLILPSFFSIIRTNFCRKWLLRCLPLALQRVQIWAAATLQTNLDYCATGIRKRYRFLAVASMHAAESTMAPMWPGVSLLPTVGALSCRPAVIWFLELGGKFGMAFNFLP